MLNSQISHHEESNLKITHSDGFSKSSSVIEMMNPLTVLKSSQDLKNM